jgi:hypothetical protein
MGQAPACESNNEHNIVLKGDNAELVKFDALGWSACTKGGEVGDQQVVSQSLQARYQLRKKPLNLEKLQPL